MRGMHISPAWVVGAAVLVGSVPSAWAERYTLIDLGTFEQSEETGSTEYAKAYGLSEGGTAVGGSKMLIYCTSVPPCSQYCGNTPCSLVEHAFRWREGQLDDLGTLGGFTSRAYGIHPQGSFVVGESKLAGNSLTHAFVYTPGVMTDIGLLLSAQGSQATAVNTLGSVVGHFTDATSIKHAFLWSAEGGAIDLLVKGVTLGGSETLPAAINGSGFIVGKARNAAGQRRGFFWPSRGRVQELSPLSGFATSEARGINSAGKVVGLSQRYPTSPPIHAALWERNATTGQWASTDLGQTNNGVANDINDAGVIVGREDWSANGTPRAVRWQKDANGVYQMVNLNDELPPDSGWVLSEATAINNAGQIIGYGGYGSFTHAFMLAPPCGQPGLPPCPQDPIAWPAHELPGGTSTVPK